MTTWWAPQRSDWWVAALFAIGSTCFALGAVPVYAEAVGPVTDDLTYFVGSIFFTSAALLQILVSTGVVPAAERPRACVRWRGLVRAPRSVEWWSGTVQFAGTLLFNVSTFAALHQAVEGSGDYDLVWAPDAYGSIAFLVASALAFADVPRPWVTWRPRDLAWSVAMLNMAGSIAFGVSAVASQLVPQSDELRDAALANLGTFVGALGFLAGAILLIPDQAGLARGDPATPRAAG